MGRHERKEIKDFLALALARCEWTLMSTQLSNDLLRPSLSAALRLRVDPPLRARPASCIRV